MTLTLRWHSCDQAFRALQCTTLLRQDDVVVCNMANTQVSTALGVFKGKSWPRAYPLLGQASAAVVA
jgi:hypothetical protein